MLAAVLAELAGSDSTAASVAALDALDTFREHARPALDGLLRAIREGSPRTQHTAVFAACWLCRFDPAFHEAPFGGVPDCRAEHRIRPEDGTRVAAALKDALPTASRTVKLAVVSGCRDLGPHGWPALPALHALLTRGEKVERAAVRATVENTDYSLLAESRDEDATAAAAALWNIRVRKGGHPAHDARRAAERGR